MEQSNSEKANEIIANLPECDRIVLEEEGKRYLNVARRFAGAAIFARNFSHGGGDNVVPKNTEKMEKSEEEISVDKVHNMALDLVRSMNLETYSNPKEALKNFPWNFGQGIEINQREMAEWNLVLDGRSCLGRTAQAAALIELHFPDSQIGYAEVISDHLRRDMIDQVHESLPYDEKLRDEWLKEVLMYEEPHAVVIVDSEQFDPLSTIYPIEINHPKIQPHPLWEGVASSVKVAESWLENDPEKKLEILETAERICPGTTVVEENKAGILITLGKIDEAIDIMKDLLERRPTARTLFCLYLLTQDEQYKQRLDKEYTPYMIDILKKEGGL